MQGKYPVITLCGSTWFKDQFMEAQNLAVNRLFKKDDTDQSADFISIVAFKNHADFLEKFGKKGVKLLITGRIQTGSYDKGGTRIYTTDVIAEQLEFAESKSSGETSESAPESGDGFTNIPDDADMPFH